MTVFCIAIASGELSPAHPVMKTTPGKGPEPAGLNNAPAIVLVVGSSTGIGITSVYPPPIGGAVWPAPIVGETSIELIASAKPATDVKKLRFTKKPPPHRARRARRRRESPSFTDASPRRFLLVIFTEQEQIRVNP